MWTPAANCSLDLFDLALEGLIVEEAPVRVPT